MLRPIYSTSAKQLFSLVVVICGMLAASPVVAQSPVGYWTFDDGFGAKATDASGSARVATLVNGVDWSSGKVGGAVSANSSLRQYVVTPAIDLSSTRAVTVAFWSKRTYSTAGGHTLLESTADFTKSTTGFVIFPDDATCAGIQAAIKGNVGETANCYDQPASGMWHHFALVFDKTQSAGNQVVLYRDGVLQNPTRSLAASTNTNDFGNNSIWLFSQGGTGGFDSGRIDDFRVYKSALTAAEIQRIFRGASLVSLVVSPATASIAPGAVQRFTATGTYGDGSRRDLSNWVTWSSVAPVVAAMSRDGSTVGIGEGQTTIKASLAGLSATAHLTVTAAQTSQSYAQEQLISGLETGSGIKLDLHGVQDNGSQASNQAAVSIGTPAAGDLITCEVTFDGHNANALVSLTDNVNGSYAAAVPAHLNTTLIQWLGIYYKQAAVASPTTVTLKTTNSGPWSAISCQAWKGVATSSPLDTAFLQSRDALATANPTTGSNKTPAGNGELIIAGLGLYTAGAPTAGTTYTLIDTAPATQWWPEYWIQTTASATAGNYIRSSDNFADMMAAFRPATTSSFTIGASPPSLTVVQGHSATATISTTASGSFSNPITLSASGLPAGTTASFSVNPIPAPGTGSSVLTLSVGTTTVAGTYAITITGTGGGLQQSTTVSLRVTSTGTFTISASPSTLSVIQGHSGTSTITTSVSGGFNNAISLSASGVPSGTSASFSSNPIPAPGSGTSTLTLTVGTSTTAGTYNIVITGSGGGIQQSTAVTLTVTLTGTFTISAAPSALSLVQGYSGTSTITTTISGGFNNAISLSASGLPSGASASFSPNPIPAPGGGSSTLTLTVGTGTAAGTYTIVITGSSGGLQRTTTVSLTVTATANFTIAASPASLSIIRGNQTASTITTSISAGFNNAVTLSASGVPSGTTVSFGTNPIPAPGVGNSTMTIAVSTSTRTGTYTLTITGTGGGLQRSTTVTLMVGAQVGLAWTASVSQVAGYNAYRATQPNGTYTLLNNGLISGTSYIDQTAQSGATYYYVTTAVTAQGIESVYSNQSAATVP